MRTDISVDELASVNQEKIEYIINLAAETTVKVIEVDYKNNLQKIDPSVIIRSLKQVSLNRLRQTILK